MLFTNIFVVKNVLNLHIIIEINGIALYYNCIIVWGCVCMYRVAIENLYKWKESKRRKPLIIEGARQVGKTWLMKEFGEKAYAHAVYINFDSNSRMAELFASDLDTDR